MTLHGDRIEIHCANVVTGTAAKVAPALADVWSGVALLDAGAAPKTHSFLFEVDTEIPGGSYQEVMNHFAGVPQSLPSGTETAVVYYLPAELGRGHGESSLVLNRSGEVEGGLQVNATLVYEAESVEPAAAISAGREPAWRTASGPGTAVD